MSDLVKRLLARQMMQDVRGTGDRFVKQVAVPDALCQQAADEIERLQTERNALAEEAEQLRAANEAFGKRQDWWTERMFELEQKLESTRLESTRILAAVERVAGRYLRDQVEKEIER